MRVRLHLLPATPSGRMPAFFNSYELQAGLRYVRAKRRNRLVSFISVASMAGIMLGVAVLIVVLSVMNGFETQLRQLTLGMASHATIAAIDGGLDDWEQIAAIAAADPEVAAVAPYIEGEGMLRVGSTLAPTEMRGVQPGAELKVSQLGQYIRSGALTDLKPGSFRILLGSTLATTLAVKPGDTVDLLIPLTTVTPAGIVPRFRRFTVAGIFQSGLFEYDNGLVVINIHDAAALYRMGDKVSGVRLRLHDLFKAPEVVRRIDHLLPGYYYVNDWTREHANYFRAVGTQKSVMFLILSMLVAIAAFNIVSTLVMVVQDKQADIAVLRTLGATPKSVMLIFMVQGTLIGVVGTVLGIGLGVLVASFATQLVNALQAVTGHRFLDPSIYFLNELPSRIQGGDVLRIGALSLMLGLVSTLYPAWRASRVQPAEALRYE